MNLPIDKACEFAQFDLANPHRLSMHALDFYIYCTLHAMNFKQIARIRWAHKADVSVTKRFVAMRQEGYSARKVVLEMLEEHEATCDWHTQS